MNRYKISPRGYSLVASALLSVTAFAVPFDSATVTRVENKVTVAEIQGNQATGRRPAEVQDVIRAHNILQTTSNARAEVQFKDKSLVRVGPSSVFSFDAKSRTLSLDKGEMLFYLVPGSGKATIKTAAVTAAITGTVVLVKDDELFVYEGTMTITDASGRKLTLTAGEGTNGVKLDKNGNFVGDGLGYHQDPKGLDSSLYKWAVLPNNAERKIAAANPGFLRSEIAGPDSGDGGGGGGGGGFGVGGGVSPSFGGGGGAGATDKTTTGVLADGKIGLFDSLGRFLGVEP